jgi:hypothetical protein
LSSNHSTRRSPGCSKSSNTLALRGGSSLTATGRCFGDRRTFFFVAHIKPCPVRGIENLAAIRPRAPAEPACYRSSFRSGLSYGNLRWPHSETNSKSCASLLQP